MEMKLTKGEEEIMQVLWGLGQGFLKEIVEGMPDPKPHSNTIATLLKILVEKGFVRYQVVGRNNLYLPTVSKLDYGRKSMKQLVKGYFEGSPVNLVSQFMKDDAISIAEMEALLKKLKAKKK